MECGRPMVYTRVTGLCCPSLDNIPLIHAHTGADRYTVGDCPRHSELALIARKNALAQNTPHWKHVDVPVTHMHVFLFRRRSTSAHTHL